MRCSGILALALVLVTGACSSAVETPAPTPRSSSDGQRGGPVNEDIFPAIRFAEEHTGGTAFSIRTAGEGYFVSTIVDGGIEYLAFTEDFTVVSDVSLLDARNDGSSGSGTSPTPDTEGTDEGEPPGDPAEPSGSEGSPGEDEDGGGRERTEPGESPTGRMAGEELSPEEEAARAERIRGRLDRSRISLADAIDAAASANPGTVVLGELLELEDGTIVFDIRITLQDQTQVDLLIDGVSGNII